jgi:hypothetical protein
MFNPVRDWETADALVGAPDVGPLWQWLLGIVLAMLVVGWGVWCIADGEVTTSSRNGPNVLTGGSATAFGLLFVFAGVFMHFHFFWMPDEKRARFGEPGKILSALAFVISAVWLPFA